MTRFIKVLATFMVVVLLAGCNGSSGYINTASVQAVWTETETPPVEEEKPTIIDTKTEDTVSIPDDVNSTISSQTSSSEDASSKATSSQASVSEVSSSETSSSETSSSEASAPSKENLSEIVTSTNQEVETFPYYGKKYFCIVGQPYLLEARYGDGYYIDPNSISISPSDASINPIEGETSSYFTADSEGEYTVTVTFVSKNTGKTGTSSTTMVAEQAFTLEEAFADIPDFYTGFES